MELHNGGSCVIALSTAHDSGNHVYPAMAIGSRVPTTLMWIGVAEI
jgi:hypothetical protein